MGTFVAGRIRRTSLSTMLSDTRRVAATNASVVASARAGRGGISERLSRHAQEVGADQRTASQERAALAVWRSGMGTRMNAGGGAGMTDALKRAHEAIDRLEKADKCTHTIGDCDRWSWCGDCEVAAFKEAHAALDEAAEEARRQGESAHDWQCGCGHWNGPNLRTCAICDRFPGEER